MKRLLTITTMIAVAIGVFLGACMAVSGNEVVISAEGLRTIAPSNPQSEPPSLNPDATGSMLGKNVTPHDAEQIVRILSAADAEARSMKAVFPGVFLPHHQETWKNDATGTTYRMSVHMPAVMLGEKDTCRYFTLENTAGGVYTHLSSLACPEPEGWSFHNATGAN
ncbi:MAG TPA: hypothetical protein PKE16_12720 [Hyphomicrobium sp.]|nr:hypothetical protein [Hyphomicrobium sp.]